MGSGLTGEQRAAFEEQWARVAMSAVPDCELVKLSVIQADLAELRFERRCAMLEDAAHVAAASSPEFAQAITDDCEQLLSELDVTEDMAFEECVRKVETTYACDEDGDEWDGEEDANDFECWEGEGEEDDWDGC